MTFLYNGKIGGKRRAYLGEKEKYTRKHLRYS